MQDNKAAVIVYIHGGPESQFIPSFIPSFQYYVTEMGISIIAPNVRRCVVRGSAVVPLVARVQASRR